MKKDNTKKEIVQITPENIKDLNIGVGSVIKDDRGDYWKITKTDDFYANMHICDKDGNEIENFVGNAGRSAFGGGLTGLLNDGVAIYYIETESPEITENPLSHVNFYVTEFAEFPTYNDTENMSLPEAVSFMRQANSTKDNESKFGTPTCFTIGLEIDGERFGNDGSSYNPLTGEFDTLMYEANSLFRKYGGHALNAIVEEIEKQNKELPENKKMPCNFNRADFGLEEKNESPVSPSEIEEEKQFIQKRIQWLKDTLNNPDRNSPDDEHFISDTKENIERLENLTDEDYKKMVLWKKQNQKNNKETHRQVAEMMNYIQTIKNAPDDGSLLSFNEMNPTHTLFNKDTGRTTSIQPFGKLEENVRKLGRLKNLTEANNVIEKIKSNGFDILSTQFRVVIYNENTFYDFDTYADSGKWNYKAENFEHNLDRRNLKDWDFKKYIDGGLKITKEMKEFEKIGIYDNTPFAGLSKEEVGKICFGLWEAEDKGLMDYHEENFPGDKYPSYPGDDFVTEYLLNNKDKYNFSELKEYFLDTNKIEIKPVTLEEILDVMEFNLEPQKSGTFKIFDRQLGEYKDNRSLLPDTDENNWTFTNAAEIFERLDIYINDYFIHDMEERLVEGGVTLRGDETLEDLCACAKQQLEAGITTVSEGELNLAMGIVHPETVIMPENNPHYTLSWKELGLDPKDYDSYGNIPSDETEFKEWALALQLENELDLRGFDTGLENVSNEDNSRISEQKWVILDELSHRIVSGELPYELHNHDYSNQQKEYDRLLKENPVFQELTSKGVIKANFENSLSGNIELTADDLKNAKALLPKEQYQLVLSYTQGEEGDHFKEIIKNISTKAEEIKGKSEILTEDEKHPLAFKYTLGNSSFYFSEWDGNDELFGYAVLNGDTQNSEWGYTSLEELKNSGGRDGNGFPVLPEMTFYGLEKTIEKQISVDYPALSEEMGFSRKKNHNEQLISEFGKEIFETLENRKLEYSAYNICCAAQFVLRTMDSSERKEVFELMEKCGCQGKNGKENTEDFLTKCVLAENKTANSEYTRKQLYEKINKACEQKNPNTGKNVHNQNNDYEREI